MTHDQVEPDANARQLARALRQQFVALVKEGFTEQQALTMLGVMIGQAMGSSNNSGQ